MTPKAFDYVRPSTLDEAISILDSAHPENGVKILAGGQSLVPLMKLRLASPGMLIDINGIDGLSYVKSNDEGSTIIGALTRYNEVLTSDLIKENFPILIASIASIADTQIRNRGTIGGNVCHVDPASDLAPALLALKANFKVVGPGGKTRVIPSDEFFLDVFTPNLEPNEILQEVSIPKTSGRSSGVYLKFTEVSGGYAIVGVAVQVALDPEIDIIHEVGIGLTAISSTPMRAKKAEETLLTYRNIPTMELIEEASMRASEEVNSLSGVEGSIRYKKQLVQVLFKRAIVRSLKELGVSI
ncbi:MAG: FAD binding domain-containing protein [Nitrososphaerales archaeon]